MTNSLAFLEVVFLFLLAAMVILIARIVPMSKIVQQQPHQFLQNVHTPFLVQLVNDLVFRVINVSTANNGVMEGLIVMIFPMKLIAVSYY